MAGGSMDISTLASSYIEAGRKNSERTREGRLLLTDAWHMDQYAALSLYM